MTAPLSLFPHVVIVGGGPAGLLAALLLGQRGVPTTVLEREAGGDELSTRSYSIVLKETRGIQALAAAGAHVLEAAQQQSLPRRAMIFLDGVTGAETVLPQREEMLAFSRPGLVRFLEEELQQLSNANANTDTIVTVRKGVLVTSIKMNCDEKNNNNDDNSNTVISIHFKEKDNETEEILTATHLIGADGKWSQVRQTFFTDDCNNQFSDTTSFSMRTEPSFGISIMCPAVPAGFRTDSTYIVKPLHAECNFYIIAAPLVTGECSVSIVCYDETVEKYPWMEPPSSLSSSSSSQRGTTANTWAHDAATNSHGENEDDDHEGDGDDNDGNDEGGGRFDKTTATETTTLAEHLAQLLQDEAPYFYRAIGREVLNQARINRRVGWVESTSTVTALSTAATKNHCGAGEEQEKRISYASANGRIVLIGDSAHAVTPSLGDGCNLALESAVELLIPSLSCCPTTTKNQEQETNNDVNVHSNNVVTLEDLTGAFRRYGLSRPPQVRPLQLKSAQASRLPKKKN